MSAGVPRVPLLALLTFYLILFLSSLAGDTGQRDPGLWIAYVVISVYWVTVNSFYQLNVCALRTVLLLPV